MKPYVEEREFAVRVVFRCQFPDDYEGELDGFAWADEVPALSAIVARAASEALRSRAGWSLSVGNRGRAAEDEVTLELVKKID